MNGKQRVTPSVAFLGISGSYSFFAFQKYFGSASTPSPKISIEDVFQAVASGECERGVVPLENSTAGSVLETYDHLLRFQLQLVGEVYLKIHHHLLVKKDKTINKSFRLSRIAKCFSHPQAFTQCSVFLKKHPKIAQEALSDTARGAQFVSESNDPTFSAIAGTLAAKIYRLQILTPRIENTKENFTRFGIIGRKTGKRGNKISLLFSLSHVPGSLVKTLLPFAKAHINLTKIESRPVFNHAWEYVFYLDFDLGEKSIEIKSLLTKLKKHVRFLKILGQYQKGKTYET
ncbi:prephenate dehydratase [Candidatus Gottesmanbacteria bacterium]|nr:prephenate dehydratase [Candidatus Gottesmanbacteria bacterium]